jgi:hypothetical protein
MPESEFTPSEVRKIISEAIDEADEELRQVNLEVSIHVAAQCVSLAYSDSDMGEPRSHVRRSEGL